jgi:hypothetical protein
VRAAPEAEEDTLKQNTLFALGAVTVLVVGAAAWVASRAPAGHSSAAPSSGLVFAALRERINDVSQVQITTSTESFTLARNEGGWGLSDKGGYPVDVSRVKALVVGLAELALVEEKTANAELWPKLELQDPTSAADAPSKRVRLSDSAGTVLADVIVGRSEFGGGTQSTLFVRKADGGPALEARGKVTVEGRASNWLDKQVTKLERTRVRDVTISHPDGHVLKIFRAAPELQDFSVADLPEGAELSWAGIAGGVAGALEYLSLEDVVPASEATFDEAQAVTARFTTFDGLAVTARTVEQDGKVFLKVQSAYDASLRAPDAVGPPPASEGEAATETPPTPPALKAVEDVQKEADATQARVAEWVYVLPGYSASNLRKRLDDLLKKPEDEAPLEMPPIAPEGGGGEAASEGGESALEIPPTLGEGEQQAPEAEEESGGEPKEPEQPAPADPGASGGSQGATPSGGSGPGGG